MTAPLLILVFGPSNLVRRMNEYIHREASHSEAYPLEYENDDVTPRWQHRC